MTLRLNGSTSGYTEVDAPATAGNNTLVLPTGNGSAQQALVGNGSGVLSFQWNAGSLFYRLNSTVVGSNSNTAQAALGVGVTVPASTVYQIEAVYLMTKTAGVTSHTISTAFGGTATLNNIGYAGVGNINNGNVVVASVTTASATAVTTAFASASGTAVIRLWGSVSINAGGTFIPQYQLSAAPGGAYSTLAGSYIRLTPIGAAGSASSQGTWS